MFVNRLILNSAARIPGIVLSYRPHTQAQVTKMHHTKALAGCEGKAIHGQVAVFLFQGDPTSHRLRGDLTFLQKRKWLRLATIENPIQTNILRITSNS